MVIPVKLWKTEDLTPLFCPQAQIPRRKPAQYTIENHQDKQSKKQNQEKTIPPLQMRKPWSKGRLWFTADITLSLFPEK